MRGKDITKELVNHWVGKTQSWRSGSMHQNNAGDQGAKFTVTFDPETKGIKKVFLKTKGGNNANDGKNA